MKTKFSRNIAIFMITLALIANFSLKAMAFNGTCYSCWGTWNPQTQSYQGGCDETNIGTMGCLLSYGECSDFGGSCVNGEPDPGEG